MQTFPLGVSILLLLIETTFSKAQSEFQVLTVTVRTCSTRAPTRDLGLPSNVAHTFPSSQDEPTLSSGTVPESTSWSFSSSIAATAVASSATALPHSISSSLTTSDVLSSGIVPNETSTNTSPSPQSLTVTMYSGTVPISEQTFAPTGLASSESVPHSFVNSVTSSNGPGVSSGVVPNDTMTSALPSSIESPVVVTMYSGTVPVEQGTWYPTGVESSQGSMSSSDFASISISSGVLTASGTDSSSSLTALSSPASGSLTAPSESILSTNGLVGSSSLSSNGNFPPQYTSGDLTSIGNTASSISTALTGSASLSASSESTLSTDGLASSSSLTAGGNTPPQYTSANPTSTGIPSSDSSSPLSSSQLPSSIFSTTGINSLSAASSVSTASSSSLPTSESVSLSPSDVSSSVTSTMETPSSLSSDNSPPVYGSSATSYPSTSSPVPSMPVSSRMAQALRTGNERLVTQQELLDQVPLALDARTSIAYDLLADNTSITWLLNPNTAFIVDSGSLEPILKGNTNLKPTTGLNNRTLAAAGRALGEPTRMAFFGGNPFVTDYGNTIPGWDPVSDPGMVALLQNLVPWMLDSPTTLSRRQDQPINIVLAGIKDSAEFTTRTAITALFPNAVINQGSSTNNACDFVGSSNSCLVGADVLIVGDNRNTGDDTVVAAVVQAYRDGLPLIVMTENGNYSPDSWKIATLLGLSLGQNYFNGDISINNSTKEYQAPSRVIQDQFRADALQIASTLGGDPLLPSDYAVCIAANGVGITSLRMTGCVNTPPVGVAAHALPYFGALSRTKAVVDGITAAGTDLFQGDVGARGETLKVLALLADKVRTGPGDQPGDDAVAIRYPIDTRTDGLATTRALFADWFFPVTTASTTPALNTGSLWCPESSDLDAGTCMPPEFPGIADYSLSLNSTRLDQWTSTGFTQAIGQPAIVTLRSDVRFPVYIRLFATTNNDARTTQYSSRGISRYDRPQFAVSTWVRLLPGIPITINSPYGGPLYLRLDGRTLSSPQSVIVDFQNVSQHLAVLDVTNDAAVRQVGLEILNSNAFWVDLVGSSFEIHTPRTRLMNALSDEGQDVGTGRRVYYNDSAQGLIQLIRDFRDSWADREYRIAGLKVGNETLAQSVPQEVQRVCEYFGWPCLDESLHSRENVQHVTYDTYAQCGNLCSGNPITSDDDPYPIGFGEGHELGHNLQRDQLDVYWPDTGTGANMAAIDTWTSYVARSQEVSNNIFPSFVQWTYFRLTLPARTGGGVDDGALRGHDPQATTHMFSARQSAYTGLISSSGNQLVILDANCRTLGSFAQGTRPDVMLADSIWSNGAYAAQASVRLSFYIALPQITSGMTLADGTVLSDGRNIYTLLYLAARTFTAYSDNATAWDVGASILGLGMYNYTDPVYGADATVADMIGNDFLLVTLSRITGYDWRPYFAAHGVFSTSLAQAQVEANGGMKDLGQPHVVLGTQYPLTNLTVVEPTAGTAYVSNNVFVDSTDADAVWPGADNNRDGIPEDLAGFHPSLCPGVVRSG